MTKQFVVFAHTASGGAPTVEGPRAHGPGSLAQAGSRRLQEITLGRGGENGPKPQTANTVQKRDLTRISPLKTGSKILGETQTSNSTEC